MLNRCLDIIFKLFIDLQHFFICLLQNCLEKIVYFIANLKQTHHSEMSNYIFRPFELTKIEYNHKIKSKQIPKPRSGHRIVCNDTNLFCFGGFNPDIFSQNNVPILFHELWKFNKHTKKWKVIINSESNMPKELASNSVLLENEMLMVFGGTGFPFGETCSNELYICYPNRKPITMSRIKTSGRKPEAQYGQTMVYHDNYLYVVGGTTGFLYFCDIHRLNLSTKEWNTVYNAQDNVGQDPKGRYRHEIAYDGKFIYVLGGGTANEAYELFEIPTFDIKNNTWKTIKTLPDILAPPPGYPCARKCHSSIQYKTDNDIEIVIAGGYDNSRFYSDIWKLSLKTYKWSLFTKTSLPRPLYFHDSATSGDGQMIIFGGIIVEENDTTRMNNMYKMWVTIPKLKSICWEAILHYYPNLQNTKKNKLLEIGIPLNYANNLQL